MLKKLKNQYKNIEELYHNDLSSVITDTQLHSMLLEEILNKKAKHKREKLRFYVEKPQKQTTSNIPVSTSTNNTGVQTIKQNIPPPTDSKFQTKAHNKELEKISTKTEEDLNLIDELSIKEDVE